MEQRAFGKTGFSFPILGFGAQRIVDSHHCSEETATRMLNYALDEGIRYFDTAWIYSSGQSEERVGLVARYRRQEMWIATKVFARDKKQARLQLEQSLRRLHTDYVDEWRLHNISSFEELDEVTAPDGVLQAAIDARNEGLVRFISISGHTNPQVQLEAISRFPFDSVLCALSVLDHFILSFAEEFLPAANSKGIAVIGMKVMGLGTLSHVWDKALRYTMSLPISTAIVGMENMTQLKKNITVARNFQPLTDSERLQLFKEILPTVSPETVPWKAKNWNKPNKWEERVSVAGVERYW